MPTPATPSSPNPAGDDRNLVPVDVSAAMSFEDKLQAFWEKNRGLIFGGCAIVILAILGKGGYDYMQRQKAGEVQKAYAAATTTDQLKTFSAAQGDHVLAGIAQLRIADEAFAAGKAADAVPAYDKAISIIKDGPLVARAKLGRAVAKAQSGKAAEATTELTQIANDAAQFKAIRAEAAYHLTSLAVEAGNAADAQKFSDLLMQIEPMSQWTQRGLQLRASLPVTATPAAPTTSEAAPAATKGDAAPGVQVTIPKK
ncbi:MAG: tetratricopeptide repeat protein [Verrucomicrobiota bacterium]